MIITMNFNHQKRVIKDSRHKQLKAPEYYNQSLIFRKKSANDVPSPIKLSNAACNHLYFALRMFHLLISIYSCLHRCSLANGTCGFSAILCLCLRSFCLFNFRLALAIKSTTHATQPIRYFPL